MDSNFSQQYKKIEILLIIGDDVPLATTKIEFNEAKMMITGNHILISTTSADKEYNTSTVVKVFELNEIAAYKTYDYNNIPKNNKTQKTKTT